MSMIFISYRSADVPFGAGLVDRALSDHFGADRVFRSSRSLRPGDEFDHEIMRAVRESAAMVVVIGPRWFGEPGGDGLRPIDRPDDFVRREIIEAFDHDVRVIPLLVEVGRLRPVDLPLELRPLAARQYRVLRVRDSHVDVAELVSSLAELMPGVVRFAPLADPPSLPGINAQIVKGVFNGRVDISRDLNIN